MTDTPSFSFELPPEQAAAPDLEAIALLGRAVQQLRVGLTALSERIDQHLPGPSAPGRASTPTGLRWADLTQEQAAATWTGLIDWTGWLVRRFQLYEELGSCWPDHPALVEELGALWLAWQASYDDQAPLEAPLRWMEALARARARWRIWDDHTRCRFGHHTQRRVELCWPPSWRAVAEQTAAADVAKRPTTSQPAVTDGGE